MTSGRVEIAKSTAANKGKGYGNFSVRMFNGGARLTSYDAETLLDDEKMTGVESVIDTIQNIISDDEFRPLIDLVTERLPEPQDPLKDVDVGAGGGLVPRLSDPCPARTTERPTQSTLCSFLPR